MKMCSLAAHFSREESNEEKHISPSVAVCMRRLPTAAHSVADPRRGVKGDPTTS